MVLPLLATRPSSLNARVKNFALASDESPRQAQGRMGSGDRAAMQAQIEQAYHQIFFHAFKADREPALESQLRNGQITMRDFIRGLLLSRKFRDGFQSCNSNTRLAEQVVGRVLGRPVYDDKERIAYSILIADKGLPALVDALLESPEYLNNFGYDRVPHQRSRVLPGKAVGDLPFNQQAPRYDAYWRDMSARRSPRGDSPWRPSGFDDGSFRLPWEPQLARPAWLLEQPTPRVRALWQNIVTAGGFLLTAFVLWTAFAMLSTGRAG